MKVQVLYRPHSEHRARIEEFINNFNSSKSLSVKMDILNIDTREGVSLASLYDITRYPAVMVVRDDGTMQKLWQGVEEIPLVNEVQGYIGV
jgi:hypothetical protein